MIRYEAGTNPLPSVHQHFDSKRKLLSLGMLGDLVGSPAPYFCFWVIQSEKEDNKVKVHLGLTLTQLLNPLPDYKILHLSKLKQIADKILKCI